MKTGVQDEFVTQSREAKNCCCLFRLVTCMYPTCQAVYSIDRLQKELSSWRQAKGPSAPLQCPVREFPCAPFSTTVGTTSWTWQRPFLRCSFLLAVLMWLNKGMLCVYSYVVFSASLLFSSSPPAGFELLYQPDVVRLYLSILTESQNFNTLEAAAGALQNLSAGNWTVSTVFPLASFTSVV